MLNVKNLSISFPSKKTYIKVVDNVNFSINQGENLAIVGESGSGKSVTAMSILRLLDDALVEGSVKFKDIELTQLSEDEYTDIRGKDIAMIFQEPMTSLNPVLTIGKQISESFVIHTSVKNPKDEVLNILKKVGFSDVDTLYHKYPHELSGGMRQRVMIAMALSCSPSILIADEPTTALDVTVQAQILSLIKKMNQIQNSSLILITHDLGIVTNYVDRVIVMYHGKIVEDCSVESLKNDTIKHPYTKALLDSSERMLPIMGNAPSPHDIFNGCSFAQRCPFAQEKCSQQSPPLTNISNNHSFSCFYPYGGV